MPNSLSLYQLLIKDNHFSEQFLERFRLYSSQDLWNALIDQHFFHELDLQHIYAASESVSCAQLTEFSLDNQLMTQFMDIDCAQLNVVLLYIDGHDLYIGVSNPYIEFPTNCFGQYRVVLVLIPCHQINQYHVSQVVDSFDVTVLLCKAFSMQVSDIHCFQRQHQFDIFFRVDGQLQYELSLSGNDQISFVQYVKLHAHMDVSCSTRPQDGKLVFDCEGKSVDARVATLPTVYGEDVVIRLYKHYFTFRSYNDLNFHPRIQSHLKTMIQFDSGLILVTGPTGSGKTTTLYTLLMQLKQQRHCVIVTLEDPVEMVLDGIRQSSINMGIGYNYVAGLKAILRQDPDVIMIGEIRDASTAEIALEAAYTGHLVLATLHTADVKSSLLRLHSFGLDPFLINHCLRGVVSQKFELKQDDLSSSYRFLLQESLLISSSLEDKQALDPLGCYVAGDLIGFV